jgi:hypothetical protein
MGLFLLFIVNNYGIIREEYEGGNTMKKGYYTSKEVMNLLNLSRWQFYDQVKRGLLPTWKEGGKIYVLASVIDQEVGHRQRTREQVQEWLHSEKKEDEIVSLKNETPEEREKRMANEFIDAVASLINRFSPEVKSLRESLLKQQLS